MWPFRAIQSMRRGCFRAKRVLWKLINRYSTSGLKTHACKLMRVTYGNMRITYTDELEHQACSLYFTVQEVQEGFGHLIGRVSHLHRYLLSDQWSDQWYRSCHDERQICTRIIFQSFMVYQVYVQHATPMAALAHALAVLCILVCEIKSSPVYTLLLVDLAY